MYYAEGLGDPPEEVSAAVAQYREDMDPLEGAFEAGVLVEDAFGAEEPDRLVFESDEVLERVEQHGDLFAPVLDQRQALPELG